MPKDIQKELLIYEYLKDKGLDISLTGFGYLVTAISYVIEHPCTSRKEVCEKVAAHHNANPKGVSASMDYALRRVVKQPLKKFLLCSSDDIRHCKLDL